SARMSRVVMSGAAAWRTDGIVTEPFHLRVAQGPGERAKADAGFRDQRSVASFATPVPRQFWEFAAAASEFPLDGDGIRRKWFHIAR
ncbi:MAG TPA: hypothetical protein VFB75_18045, partial [Burkholderiales bacterium]|nr:hypothetical protein [Burkholderiales bacterium]